MSGSEPITVLVVDDSLVCREMLSQILASDPEIVIVGTARDGIEAVEMTKRLRPGLVTMDIHMPKLDGVAATEEIMAFAPTPILVVSSSVRPDQTGPAFDALDAGALDVLKKPEPKDWSELDRLGGDLIAKVKMLARVKVITHVRGRLRERAARRERVPVGSFPVGAGRSLVVIGSSTGGPSALMEVLSGLPAELGPAVVVAQHIADGFVPGLVDWLASQSKIPILAATDGQELTGGRVLFAPTGGHLQIKAGYVRFLPAGPAELYRPSVDVLFESAAASYGGAAIGVILTGMGSDGAKGLKALHDAGGYTIAQDEGSSVIFGMPKAAIDIEAVDVVAPIERIASEVVAALAVPSPQPRP